jgi:hypothetical protein
MDKIKIRRFQMFSYRFHKNSSENLMASNTFKNFLYQKPAESLNSIKVSKISAITDEV